MSKADRNEQIDDDILQCKADILRARGTKPPHKNKTGQEPKTQETNENTTPSTVAAESAEEEKTRRKDTTEQIKPGKEKLVESASAQQEKTEIPRFDLAEEIMAEQRKIIAIKRKAPGERKEAQSQELKAEPTGYSIEQPTPAQSYQEQIVAEIVTRDIERLCRGDSSGDKTG